jgi:hypothetical protein
MFVGNNWCTASASSRPSRHWLGDTPLSMRKGNPVNDEGSHVTSTFSTQRLCLEVDLVQLCRMFTCCDYANTPLCQFMLRLEAFRYTHGLFWRWDSHNRKAHRGARTFLSASLSVAAMIVGRVSVTKPSRVESAVWTVAATCQESDTCFRALLANRRVTPAPEQRTVAGFGLYTAHTHYVAGVDRSCVEWKWTAERAKYPQRVCVPLPALAYLISSSLPSRCDTIVWWGQFSTDHCCVCVKPSSVERGGWCQRQDSRLLAGRSYHCSQDGE